jgi:hypothetical protein
MATLAAFLFAAIRPALAADVVVSGAWARATAPGQDSGAVYLTLKSPARLKLVDVASPVAGSAMFHWMAMQDGVMKMGRQERMSLLASEPLELKPGGSHIMLMDLKKPLKEGERVPLTLTFKRHDNSQFKVDVSAEVRPLTGAAPDDAAPAQAGHNHHDHR